MPTSNRKTQGPSDATVVQFDNAVLEACGPELRAELMAEAAMLAAALSSEGRATELRAIAQALVRGGGGEMERGRALRLACALRVLARGADAP